MTQAVAFTGLFDRIGQLGRLAELLGGIDLSLLDDAFEALKEVTSATDLKGRVRGALKLAEIVALSTATKKDDAVLAVFASVDFDQLIDRVTEAVEKLKADAMPTPTPPVLYTASANGAQAMAVNPLAVIQLAMSVISLLDKLGILGGNGRVPKFGLAEVDGWKVDYRVNHRR